MADLISVMIVDDEKLTLEDLSTLVDWEACGYKIVATAFNGKQALKRYRELQPQLILTDIRMPFMDGIEMISQIRKIDQKVNIVLLTAYEEFGYAKAAIRLGITEYLIKSEITAESLKALLDRLSASIIQQERKNKILTDRMLEQFFLAESFSEDQDMEQFLQKMVHVLLVEQDLPVSVSGETLQTGIAVPKVKMVDLLSHLSYNGWKLEAITSLAGGQIVLALNREKDIYADNREALHACAEYIRKQLKECTSYSFTVYAFENRTNLYHLKRYCDENKSAFQKKYFSGSGKVRTLEYPFVMEKTASKEDAEQRNMEEILNLHSRKEIQQYFERLYGEITERENLKLLLRVSKDCYYVLQNAYRQLPGKMAYEDLSLEHNWINWLDAEKICGWFVDQLDRLNTYTLTNVHHYSRPIVETIEYIYHNYRNPDLSLNDIADHVHLSVGYLSGAFKKEVGITLKNYITDVRIESAKKLMEKGNYKIYEICSAVGYHSSQYFSQAFYKKVGMFPTEYRRKE